MARPTKYGDCEYCRSRILWRDLPTNRPHAYIKKGFCSRDCEKSNAEYLKEAEGRTSGASPQRARHTNL